MTTLRPGPRTPSQAERAALVDVLLDVGPGAPTLCAGWSARHLAAHVLVRERWPDLLPGLTAPPRSWRHRRLHDEQDRVAARPFPSVVTDLRDGPPRWSPFALPGVDAQASLHELFVHCEDVRRARPGWEPRPADPDRERRLWNVFRLLGRVLLRTSPVRVRMLAPGDREHLFRHRHAGADQVELWGQPSELALFLFGRHDHANVELHGPAGAVMALRRHSPGL